jgi:VWFA-related protein
MTFFRTRTFFVFLLCAAALFLPLLSQAQAGAQILINYPELTEEGDGLALGVYFNVTDSSGRVLPNAEVTTARLLLDDGQSYEATVAQPDSPIYITLVLDASGSMGGAAGAMREAATQAVNNAPEGANIAVVRFNDTVDTLTDFTDDRSRVTDAIAQVQPINLAGTCLYDATFRAVELMRQAPPGRRAIILFTDGRDETASGEVCSSHTLSEVIDIANQPDFRVPIHTIGLSGGNSAINAGELRDIAGTTGGLSVIGDQAALSASFGQIMDALKSQWLARAITFPTAGQHSATVQVTLADSSFPQPGVVTFISPKDYFVQPTITPTQPTPTPTIVTIAVDSISFDPSAETISVNVLVENEQLINEYRFEFKDENNLLQAEFLIPAPLEETTTFPSRNLKDGQVTIVVTGLDADRRIVGRGEPTEFTYQGPTATPAPPTETPEPVSATLTSIQYDEAEDIITLNVSLLGQAQMDQLQVNVVNGDTNLLEQTYSFDPSNRIQLPSEGLVPGQQYLIDVIAIGPNGQIINESDSTFVYSPLLTPTPTPIAVEAAITTIQTNDAKDAFVVSVQTTNEDLIDRYELRFVDAETNNLVARLDFNTPPFDRLEVPMSEVRDGQYEITLNAFNAQSELLDSAVIEARITLPTPTPTATPLTGLNAFFATARSNPVILIVIAAIAAALVVLLIVLLRQPKKKTGTGFLQELTNVQQIPTAPRGASTKPKANAEAEATNVVPHFHGGMDPEATNVVPATMLPPASLNVNRTRAANIRAGQSIPISHVPFTIGRKGRDVNFEGDDNVSRSHAEITFSNDTYYIVDQGSTHGTQVNGKRISPNAPVALSRGSQITLGTTTVLVFESSGSASEIDYDPDRTSY